MDADGLEMLREKLAGTDYLRLHRDIFCLSWVTEGSLLLQILLSMYGNENKIHNEASYPVALFLSSHGFKFSASVYVTIRKIWGVMSVVVPAFHMSPFAWLMIAMGKINIKSLTTQMAKPLRLMKIRYRSSAKGSDWYLINTNLRALAIWGTSQYKDGMIPV